MRTGLLTLALILLPLRGYAEPPPATTSATSLVPGSRILKTFDFEERALGNYEAIPMFWSKVAGHGYPAYASGQFDSTVFRSAGHSFKLEIDGGSAAFQYMPGKLRINPAADYYILAFVKTTPLDHAKAQISAWFADDAGKILPGSGLYSQPYAETRGEGGNSDVGGKNGHGADWHILHLYVPGPGTKGAGAQAKSLVLQVGLLQPQQLAGPAAVNHLGKFAMYEQDIKGAAWFDDIVIFQLPRLGVSVPATIPANIFSPGQNVELDLTVSDLPTSNPAAAGKLAATLRITDPDGLLFAGEKFAVEASDKDPWNHHFTHAPLPPGLYTATLDVADSAGGTLIARRQTRFLTLAPPFQTLATPPAEFGFTLPPGAALWSELPHVLRQTQAGLVQVPAWRPDMSDDQLLRRDPAFDALLATLQRHNIHAIADFSEMPAMLSKRITEARGKNADQPLSPPPHPDLNPPSADSILALYDTDPALWRPYVSFLLARYAGRIDAWEFGSPETPYSGVIPAEFGTFAAGDARYPKLYARTSAEVTALLNEPRLMIPWNALFELDATLYPGARLDLRLPATIKPSQIPAYIDNFKQALSPAATSQPGAISQPGAAKPVASADAPSILAHIDALDEEHYDRNERLADFAQRIVYARTASPTAITIDLPMSTALRASGEDAARFAPRPEPDELLLVYRTLIQAMGNSRYVREIPLARGVRAFLFDRGGVGTLILWNESAPEPRVHLDLPLGSGTAGAGPRQIDLAGNCRPLAMEADKSVWGVNVTSTPMILNQIDSKALQLRASFTLAATTFPAGAGAARTEVLLTNPYDDTLAGNLKMTLPKGWSMDPPMISVSLAPGASLRKAVTIRYPYSERAGHTTIAGELTTDNGETHGFSCGILISSDVVELDSSSQLLPSGDLLVQEIITNISHAPLSAQAYASVPGYPRQQRYLLDLEPGQTTIKRLVFPVASYVNKTADTKAKDIAAALTGKTAEVGLRQNDGRVLITKALPLE